MSTNELEIANLNMESVDLKNKHAALVAQMKPIQGELASLKNRARTSNTHMTRLSPADYRQLCNRQTVLTRKLAELEVQASPLKARLREVGALSTLYYATRTGERADSSAASVATAADMRRAIVELRGQWLAFAEDQTRVNSMRVMAAQFSRELTDILAAPEAP
jgi:chromosome segregation ATPase